MVRVSISAATLLFAASPAKRSWWGDFDRWWKTYAGGRQHHGMFQVVFFLA